MNLEDKHYEALENGYNKIQTNIMNIWKEFEPKLAACDPTSKEYKEYLTLYAVFVKNERKKIEKLYFDAGTLGLKNFDDYVKSELEKLKSSHEHCGAIPPSNVVQNRASAVKNKEIEQTEILKFIVFERSTEYQRHNPLLVASSGLKACFNAILSAVPVKKAMRSVKQLVTPMSDQMNAVKPLNVEEKDILKNDPVAKIIILKESTLEKSTGGEAAFYDAPQIIHFRTRERTPAVYFFPTHRCKLRSDCSRQASCSLSLRENKLSDLVFRSETPSHVEKINYNNMLYKYKNDLSILRLKKEPGENTVDLLSYKYIAVIQCYPDDDKDAENIIEKVKSQMWKTWWSRIIVVVDIEDISSQINNHAGDVLGRIKIMAETDNRVEVMKSGCYNLLFNCFFQDYYQTYVG